MEIIISVIFIHGDGTENTATNFNVIEELIKGKERVFFQLEYVVGRGS